MACAWKSAIMPRPTMPKPRGEPDGADIYFRRGMATKRHKNSRLGRRKFPGRRSAPSEFHPPASLLRIFAANKSGRVVRPERGHDFRQQVGGVDGTVVAVNDFPARRDEHGVRERAG